jgi:hypothetical protein
MRNKILKDIILGKNTEKSESFFNQHKGMVFSIRDFPGKHNLSSRHFHMKWLQSSRKVENIFPNACSIVFKSRLHYEQCWHNSMKFYLLMKNGSKNCAARGSRLSDFNSWHLNQVLEQLNQYDETLNSATDVGPVARPGTLSFINNWLGAQLQY